MASTDGQVVYRIRHRLTGLVWRDRKGKQIWTALHDAVQAYNDYRRDNSEPCYSAQNTWVAVATKIKVVK